MTTLRKYRTDADPSPFMGVLKSMSFQAENMGLPVVRLRQVTPDGEVSLLRTAGIEIVDIVPIGDIKANFSMEYNSDNGLCELNYASIYLKDRDGIRYFYNQPSPYYLKTLTEIPSVTDVWDFFCSKGIAPGGGYLANQQGMLLFDSGCFKINNIDSTLKVTWWDTQYGPKDSWGKPAGYFSFYEAMTNLGSYGSGGGTPIRPKGVVTGKAIGIYNVNKRYYFKVYSFMFDPSKVESLNGITYNEGKKAFLFTSKLDAGIPSFLLNVNAFPSKGNSCGSAWFVPKNYTNWKDFLINGWNKIKNNSLYKMGISLYETSTSSSSQNEDSFLLNECARAYGLQPQPGSFNPAGKTIADIFTERQNIQNAHPTWTYEIAYYLSDPDAINYVAIYDYLYQGPWPYQNYYHTVSSTEIGAYSVRPEQNWFSDNTTGTTTITLTISPNKSEGNYSPSIGDIIYRYVEDEVTLVFPWVIPENLGLLGSLSEVSGYSGVLYNYIKQFGAMGVDSTGTVDAFTYLNIKEIISGIMFPRIWHKTLTTKISSGEIPAYYSNEKNSSSASGTISITQALPDNYYKSVGSIYGNPYASFYQLPCKNIG